MSDFQALSGRLNRCMRKRRDGAGITTDRETAFRLLQGCVGAELRCLGELLSYLRENAAGTRHLLEEVLRLEEEHAEELVGLLQLHGAAREPQGSAGPAAPVAG